MSGSTIGAVVGATVGFMVGGPTGARIGFTIGSAVGGYVDPVKIKGPRLSDLNAQSAQEGSPIPFGYGSFPCPTQVVWQGPVVEHKHKEGGKGGPQQITYTYTRSYAIGVCEGQGDIAMLWRNGKLVYDITPTSTIRAQNAKFLSKCTIYRGTEAQLVDPTIEAVEGVGNTGPMRGLVYFVVEDDETNAGEIAQWKAVAQRCGTVSTTTLKNFISCGQAGNVQTSADAINWTAQTGGLSGVSLRFSAASASTVVAVTAGGKFYYSTDKGLNWTASATAAFSTLSVTEIAYGNNTFLALARDGSANEYILGSYDNGATWAVVNSTLGVIQTNYLTFGAGLFVLAAGAGATAGQGIWTSPTGVTWTNRYSANTLNCVAWSGSGFMAANAGIITSADGITWTSPGAQPSAGLSVVTGWSGVWIVASAAGIWRSTNGGISWTNVNGAVGGTLYSAANNGRGVAILGAGGGGGAVEMQTQNGGITWTQITPSLNDVSLTYIAPESTWLTVPDAPGAYVDANGVLRTDYIESQQISSCDAVLSDIVGDLCNRAGIVAGEIDASQLTDYVRGYACATEASAQAFIDPLTQGFFFDRGEWDKKIRFIKRGGAAAFSLTMNDLVAQDGPAIEQTRVQEVELLRKTTVMTLDPAAEFNQKPQFWERTVATINAKGESTVEIPLVCTADTAKQIAHKRSNVAWSETAKFKAGVTVAWSKLTPTDVGTLTDKGGVVHRLRLTSQNEESGVFTIEEAVTDRASAYVSTATGAVTDTPGTTSADLIGPTLFAALNLPQIRTQDNVPGMWIGATGILGGWAGCQILLSVDGGLSYAVALTITEATTMGFLTAAISGSGTPLSVHVFGGALESKTLFQIGLGANWAAVLSGATAEVLAYETATPTAAVGTSLDYNLTTLYRNLKSSGAAAHAVGDKFMDIKTAYFLPISNDYAGQTLYFKAVALGVSPDAVAAVSAVFSGSTYVYDGGAIT